MDREADRLFFENRGFSKRIGFGERSAVLVLDLMRAFTDPEMALGSNLDALMDPVRRLTAVARAHGVPIAYSVTRYEEPDCRDAGIWALKVAGSFQLRAGTPAVDLDPRLDRQPEDLVIAKKYASAFFGTDLATRLTTRRVDTLILAGATTSGCVRATAVDALQHGFRPIVALEAVGDRSEAAHAQSLFDLDAKYADVMRLEEILAHLGAASEPSGTP